MIGRRARARVSVAPPPQDPLPMASMPSAQFSLTLRVVLDRRPGALARVAHAIGDAGGSIGAVDIIEQREHETVRELTVDASDAEHWERIVAAVEQVPDA